MLNFDGLLENFWKVSGFRNKRSSITFGYTPAWLYRILLEVRLSPQALMTRCHCTEYVFTILTKEEMITYTVIISNNNEDSSLFTVLSLNVHYSRLPNFIMRRANCVTLWLFKSLKSHYCITNTVVILIIANTLITIQI